MLWGLEKEGSFVWYSLLHLNPVISTPWLNPLGLFSPYPVLAQVGEFGFAVMRGIP